MPQSGTRRAMGTVHKRKIATKTQSRDVWRSLTTCHFTTQTFFKTPLLCRIQQEIMSSPCNRPRRPRDGVQAQLYSFFNLGTIRGGWSTPRPGRFPPGKTRYPLYRKLGGPRGRSRWVRNISPPPGFSPRTVQPVASRYTD
jgi:hypothetical protein